MTIDGNHNVVAAFEETVTRVSARAALVIDRGGRTENVTFAELWDRADRISMGLLRAGFKPGERAVLMVPLSATLYALLIGILKMGGVAVFVSPWLSPKHVALSAEFAEPSVYIGSPKSQLLRLRHACLTEIPLSVTTGARLWRVPARRSLREIESAPGGGTVHTVAASDAALISFTSGSSDAPKAANRTHDTLTGQRLALAEEFPLRDDDVDMTMFPVFVLNNLANGVTSVVPHMSFRDAARVDAAATTALMLDHGVTTCAASPPIIDRLAAHLQAKPEISTRLRRVLSGGAPVFDTQLHTWRSAFGSAEVIVAYGSTEAEPVAHISAAGRLDAKSDVLPRSPGICVGRPIGRVRTKLIRVHNGPVALEGGDWSPWEIPRSEIGELVVAGRHVCRDYYRNPAATAEAKIADADGTVWHRMGDTGYFDGEGRFWLAGRVHSTIHRGERTVHPQLVEQAALADRDDVRRAAAIGLPDDEFGERVVLVLETGSPEGLKAETERRLEDAGQPVDEIVITDEPLPLDRRHRAKIDYTRLRKRLERRPGRDEGDI